MAFEKGIYKRKNNIKGSAFFKWITQKLYFTKLHPIVSVDRSAIISELQKYYFQIPKADICDEGQVGKEGNYPVLLYTIISQCMFYYVDIIINIMLILLLKK